MKRIVCMGDSLTYGYGVRRAATWTALVSRMSENVELVNKGISGDTTSGMLARFEKDVLEEKSDLVFLMGGSNDIFFSHSIAAARNNISAMVNRCLYERIPVVLGLPFAICEPALAPEWRFYAMQPQVPPLIQEYEGWIREFAHNFRIPLLEMENALPEDTEKRIQCSLDGVHLNETGHELAAQYFAGELKNILK